MINVRHCREKPFPETELASWSDLVVRCMKRPARPIITVGSLIVISNQEIAKAFNARLHSNIPYLHTSDATSSTNADSDYDDIYCYSWRHKLLSSSLEYRYVDFQVQKKFSKTRFGRTSVDLELGHGYVLLDHTTPLTAGRTSGGMR